LFDPHNRVKLSQLFVALLLVLTYMSIEALIEGHLAAGRLHRLSPVLDSDPIVRKMIISPKINGLIEGPWESEEMRDRCNALRANLEAFVKGDNITLSLTPHEHKTAYMGRLDKPKDEVWDIRSRDPSPGIPGLFSSQ
jgi:hypothetical protein